MAEALACRDAKQNRKKGKLKVSTARIKKTFEVGKKSFTQGLTWVVISFFVKNLFLMMINCWLGPWFIWKQNQMNSHHENETAKVLDQEKLLLLLLLRRESCYINKYLFHGRLHKTYGKWNIYFAAFQDASFSRVDDDNKNANKLGNLIWVMVHFRGPAPAYYHKLSRITLQMGRASGMFMDDAIDTFKKHSKQWKDESSGFYYLSEYI